jgi:magnesium transporter
MIRISAWNQQGQLLTNLSLQECQKKLKSSRDLTWADIYDEGYEQSYAILKDIFKFHPLAIEDALEETHVPKIDDWGDYLTMVMSVIQFPGTSGGPKITQEVDIFIGKNFILTYHLKESETINRIWQRSLKGTRSAKHGAAFLLYLLLDETADDYIEYADQLDLQINALEDKLFDNPDPSLLEDIFSLKRMILDLLQSIGPQREVLNKLARGDYSMLARESNMYFRDVYDHFIRLYELVENLRDLTGNTLEIFLSLVNNRMNGIMKTLTIITSLFMPISFLAGFFGMNFFAPPETFEIWTTSPFFYIVLAACILFPLAMLAYFFKQGWMK